MNKAKNVDAYIAAAPKEVQSKLKEIRKAIKEAAPDAMESISYRMPYYARRGNLPWNERSIVWFGLQSKHIGLYLPPPIVEEHQRELAAYKTTKSAIHFPLDKKIPIALIKKLVKARTRKNDAVSQKGENMSREFVAKASVSIRASADRVWDAFTKSEVIKQYMFGTDVLSDWKEGSSIAWNGEWQGKRYEDKGVILKLKPRRLIQYSHFSPLSGLLDKPENHHIVTIELSSKGKVTIVSLTQDNNGTEEAKKHSEQNWTMMLQELKKLLEK